MAASQVLEWTPQTKNDAEPHRPNNFSSTAKRPPLCMQSLASSSIPSARTTLGSTCTGAQTSLRHTNCMVQGEQRCDAEWLATAARSRRCRHISISRSRLSDDTTPEHVSPGDRMARGSKVGRTFSNRPPKRCAKPMDFAIARHVGDHPTEATADGFGIRCALLAACPHRVVWNMFRGRSARVIPIHRRSPGQRHRPSHCERGHKARMITTSTLPSRFTTTPTSRGFEVRRGPASPIAPPGARPSMRWVLSALAGHAAAAQGEQRGICRRPPRGRLGERLVPTKSLARVQPVSGLGLVLNGQLRASAGAVHSLAHQHNLPSGDAFALKNRGFCAAVLPSQKGMHSLRPPVRFSLPLTLTARPSGTPRPPALPQTWAGGPFMSSTHVRGTSEHAPWPLEQKAAQSPAALPPGRANDAPGALARPQPCGHKAVRRPMRTTHGARHFERRPRTKNLPSGVVATSDMWRD